MPSSDPSDLAGVVDDAALDRLWRDAVLALRYEERRRVFPVVVHVGRPDGGAVAFSDPADGRRSRVRPLDHAVRADVVGALIERRVHRATGRPTSPPAWITRTGGLEPHDEDLAWFAAARTAYDEADMLLDLVVVTRAGWYRPRDGSGRAWRRLRRR